MLIFVTLTLGLTTALAYFTYRSAQLLPTLPPDANVVFSTPDVAVRFVLCLVWVGLGLLSGVGPGPLGWAPPAPGDDIRLGVALGLIGHLLLYPLPRWAIRHFGPQAYSTYLLRVVLPKTRRQWLAAPLVFGVAVLFEELWFRSLLLGAMTAILVLPLPLGEGWGEGLLLAFLSAVLFGWLHKPQGWLGMLIAGVVSLGLGILFLTRHSLLAPLVAHWLFNLLQLIRAGRELDTTVG